MKNNQSFFGLVIYIIKLVFQMFNNRKKKQKEKFDKVNEALLQDYIELNEKNEKNKNNNKPIINNLNNMF